MATCLDDALIGTCKACPYKGCSSLRTKETSLLSTVTEWMSKERTSRTHSETSFSGKINQVAVPSRRRSVKFTRKLKLSESAATSSIFACDCCKFLIESASVV